LGASREVDAMGDPSPFGQWLKQRRRALDLTQEALAGCVGCSLPTIEKIEGGTRRPSRQIAERLAECLAIPSGERDAFVRYARGGQSPEDLPGLPEPATPAEIAAAAAAAAAEQARAEERARANWELRRQAVFLLAALVVAGVAALLTLNWGRQARLVEVLVAVMILAGSWPSRDRGSAGATSPSGLPLTSVSSE
jgi:transcriptional regulator with XRE-family HTH domain